MNDDYPTDFEKDVARLEGKIRATTKGFIGVAKFAGTEYDYDIETDHEAGEITVSVTEAEE